MKKIILATTILVSLRSNAQLPILQADSIKQHYQAKLNDLLIGDSSLYSQVDIDIYGVTVRAPGQAVFAQEQSPLRVTWSELPIYKNVMTFETCADARDILILKGSRSFSPAVQKQYGNGFITKEKTSFRTPMKPLAGLKIALDPGHVANDTAMGHIEQKYIHMNVPFSVNNQEDSVPVAFAEGQLTWQTANVLAYRLRAAGAEVILTRSGPGMTAFGKTFEQWKKDDFMRTLDSLLKLDPQNQNLKDVKSGKLKDDRSIFRFVFRDAELRKRTEIINAFRPDFTLIIHYNVDEKNAPWTRPSTKNYCMLFVPGSFEAGELATPEDRFDFLRLLLMDDLENSILIGDKINEQFKAKLDVPLATMDDATYLSTSCRKVYRQGIYARNLSMTRLVHGPVVYGETLYQDNRYEARMLADMSITDMQSKQTTSKRVLQVADAYYEGILQWSYTR